MGRRRVSPVRRSLPRLPTPVRPSTQAPTSPGEGTKGRHHPGQRFTWGEGSKSKERGGFPLGRAAVGGAGARGGNELV